MFKCMNCGSGRMTVSKAMKSTKYSVVCHNCGRQRVVPIDPEQVKNHDLILANKVFNLISDEGKPIQNHQGYLVI